MQEFEKLDVYRVASEFDGLMMAALAGRQSGDIEQLDRATCSVLNNIAEASAYPPGSNKRRIYRIALAEAAECLSLVSRLERRGHIFRLTHNHARSLIERVIRMLCRLAGVLPDRPEPRPPASARHEPHPTD